LQRFGDVVDTNEPNGTEIQIGVKEYDLNKFIQAVYRTTMFWTVRPNIKHRSY
jgi:hypothetical protein